MDQNIRFKKTKIVATIGPATENEKAMTALANAGMDVVRLNFSHGDHAEHKKRIELARKVSKKLGKPIGILQDLSGPKIRIGDFYTERVMLKKGSVFTLTTEKIVGDETKAYVNYHNLPRDVRKGSIILLDDGKKKLEVLSTAKNSIKTRVLIGGETKGRRGVNVPGAYLKIPAITAKDRKDLAFGVRNNVDFVALSFVRRANDVHDLRKLLQKHRSDAHIIAKIETEEAIENIDEIIDAADGVMVARGDLAIEVPAHDVPLLQKMIIQKCNIAGKPVITATQMLESMIRSAVPTRAEVSDVANSILDGTDAVMLSEETTLGDYPMHAVTVMSQVGGRVELMSRKRGLTDARGVKGIVDAVSSSIVNVADEVDAKAIVALTESGFTPRMISRFKPRQPIIVMTPNIRTLSKITLSFGCIPIAIKGFRFVGEVTNLAGEFTRKHGIAKKGDKIVIAAGVPFGRSGATNMLLVHVV